MDGQRTKKIVTDPTTGTTTTTEYFYNGSILAGQRTGNDEIVFMYDNNGDVFGFEYNGTPYYYVKNAQNDVYLILDENGYAQVLYQYDAWGNVTCAVDATDFGLAGKNPIMYRSYYVDLEMGMFIYYLNSRYYIADWGRFASADTTDILSVQSDLYDKNLFAYCDNNPVIRVDVSGYAWETIFDIASLCLSMAEVATNPSDALAWVGLAFDTLDLIPFVTGLGETAKAIRLSKKGIEAAGDAGKSVKNLMNIADSPSMLKKSSVKIHGNSLKSPKINYGYVLIDKHNNIMKFGETINPNTRYSQKYLLKNDITMQIMTSGSKADIHYWQYDMNMYYKNQYGIFPPLNKRGW